MAALKAGSRHREYILRRNALQRKALVDCKGVHLVATVQDAIVVAGQASHCTIDVLRRQMAALKLDQQRSKPGKVAGAQNPEPVMLHVDLKKVRSRSSRSFRAGHSRSGKGQGRPPVSWCAVAFPRFWDPPKKRRIHNLWNCGRHSFDHTW